MKYKKNFQATQNPCWHGIRGRAGLTPSSAPAGKGEGQGLVLHRVLFFLSFSRSGCWENPTVPSRLIPALPRIPGCGNRNAARGRQNTLGCPGEAAAAGTPHGRVSQPLSSPKSAALFCSDTAQRPHPHPARRGKGTGNTLDVDVPRERLCPVLSTARCPSATRIAKSRAALYLP